MNLQHERMLSLCENLSLPFVAQSYAIAAQEAAQQDTAYSDFLEQLLKTEAAGRCVRKQSMLTRLAGFPAIKTLEEFDYDFAAGVKRSQIDELAGLGFIERSENVVLVGPSGVGKTHLAIALGREACRKGFRVKFFTGSGLVNTYLEAREQKTILRLEAQIAKCDAVVIDELGYIPMDKVGAEHLFGFFSLCYERTSLIITTNLPFADWPRIFGGDERLAGALIDRLTHRINLLEILGDSYRFHSSLRKRKDGAIKDND